MDWLGLDSDFCHAKLYRVREADGNGRYRSGVKRQTSEVRQLMRFTRSKNRFNVAMGNRSYSDGRYCVLRRDAARVRESRVDIASTPLVGSRITSPLYRLTPQALSLAEFSNRLGGSSCEGRGGRR